MPTYKDKCPYCGELSNNTDNAIYCSNPDCWKVMIDTITNHRKKTRGLTSDNPKVVRCPQCHECAKIGGSNYSRCLFCEDYDGHHYTFENNFVAGHWYRFRDRVIQYHTKKANWNYKTAISMDKSPLRLKSPISTIKKTKLFLKKPAVVGNKKLIELIAEKKKQRKLLSPKKNEEATKSRI